jgi:hypothetical protein
MNERWKDLIKQAIQEIGPEDNPSKEETLKRYAELMVRECIDVALSERVSEEEIDMSDDIVYCCYLRGNNGGIVDAVIAMKQHFGVEE